MDDALEGLLGSLRKSQRTVITLVVKALASLREARCPIAVKNQGSPTLSLVGGLTHRPDFRFFQAPHRQIHL